MQSKRKLPYTAVGCVVLLIGALLLINVWAQAPPRAQIVFQSDRDRDDEIYIMDADGRNQRNLTNDSGSDTEPIWSPDGGNVAFRSARDGNEEVYIMDADGKNQRNLTNNPGSDGGQVWSPDGHGIAFHSNRDGNYEVYVMEADGQNPRNITNHPADDRCPDWFDPAYAYAVKPAEKMNSTWGKIKLELLPR